MRVSDQGYSLMTERLLGLGGGRCVVALEGGYGLTAIAAAAAATLGTLLGVMPRPRGVYVSTCVYMCLHTLATSSCELSTQLKKRGF